MGLFENNQFPYTNFHEMNLDWIAEKIEDAAGISENINGRVTQCETDIQTLDGRMDTAEGRITSQGNRLTTAEGDIDTLETTTGSQGTRLTTAEGDIDALEGRMDTAEGDIDALEGRMDTAEGDIDALEGRMDTAEGDIDSLESTVAGKSTVTVTQGSLTGGVLVGTVSIDGTSTRLYAPTAGSTVVRAMDVPFDNTGLTPPMTAIECQEAIEELNTNIGTEAAARQTADATLTSDLATEVTNRQTAVAGVASDLASEVSARQTAVSDIYEYFRNVTYNSGMGNIILDNVIAPGFVYADGAGVRFWVPWTRMFGRGEPNPVDDTSRYTFTIVGNIFVRGVNGYILNNVSLASSSITNIEIIPDVAGVKVTLTLATPATVGNATPCTCTFTSTPYIRWTRTS